VTTTSRYPSIVSIHDVAPESLGAVREILDLLEQLDVAPVTLLVIPGRDWKDAELDQLDQWQQKGIALAGHGWSHRCGEIRTLYHQFHSAVLSRDMAEHLSHTEDEIIDLMMRCHKWFTDVGLQPPNLYVPPAWAVGSATTTRLAETPFTLLEDLTGVMDLTTLRHVTMPLVGYEADTFLRSLGLSIFNGLNQAAAGLFTRTLRIGIHPLDLTHGLASDLRTILKYTTGAVSYDEAMQAGH